MVRRIRYLLIKPIKQHFQELLEINCRNVCAFSNQLISLRDRLEFCPYLYAIAQLHTLYS